MYLTQTRKIVKIDEYKNEVMFDDKTRILIDELIEIRGEMFEE